MEYVGRYLDYTVDRTYDIVIPDIACIGSDGLKPREFLQQPGVDVPGLTWWDRTRCAQCIPSCQENSVCDYKGHGMCICPNSNHAGPFCHDIGTIQFRSSGLVYNAIEHQIGYTRVETIEIPIRRNLRRGTGMDFRFSYSRVPFHAIDLDGSDPTVDPFLSEFIWLNEGSGQSIQDGHLTIQIPILNEDGARNAIQDIRVGMAIASTVRYPDYQIASDSQVTVRVHPFGGYIQFETSVIFLSETSTSSSDACDVRVQRFGGKGGTATALIKLIKTSDAGEGNVCSESIDKDLSLKDDLNLDTPYFNLTWSDQDTSDRCLNFDVVDDASSEGNEVICLHIEQVGGTAYISDTGNTYAVLSIKDDDTSYTLAISLTVVGILLLGGAGVFFRLQRQRLVATYIKIKYAVEVSECRCVFLF